MIERNELAECVEKVKVAIEKLKNYNIQPTEFEAVTAAAFVYFYKALPETKGKSLEELEKDLIK